MRKGRGGNEAVPATCVSSSAKSFAREARKSYSTPKPGEHRVAQILRALLVSVLKYLRATREEELSKNGALPSGNSLAAAAATA